MTVNALGQKNVIAMPPLPLRRFTVAEYHRMIETGILSEADDVELLDGWIAQKLSRNPPHDAALGLVQAALAAVLPGEWICRSQSAVTTSESEPEPDVAVVRGPIRRYVDHHPRPDETALVVEVADTSLDRDRNDKGPIYARDRIATYWIVNVPDQQIEVYAAPSGPVDQPTYQQRRDFRRGEAVPVLIAGLEIGTIQTSDLLP
jgi:Uma2 family endonuclease